MMQTTNIETYAVSMFDMLENKPYVHYVEAASDVEQEQLEVMALQKTYPDDGITIEFVRANPELFKDMIIISIFKTEAKSIYERL